MSMNMHCRVGTSVSEDLNSFHHQLYVNPLQFCTSRVEGNTVNDIGTALTKFLNIQDDDHKKASSFISSSKSSSLNGVENQDMCEEEPLHFDKCLTKPATFPGPVEIESPSVDASLGCQNEEDVITELITNFESVNPLHSPSQSLPAPSKLVSSMKGRREKQGTRLKEKLNVTWAPDVYDPVPTSVSHLLTSKSQRQNHHHHHRSSSNSSSKKHGKSKHKGSSGKSPRSSGKDKKKQSRRVSYGGGSSSSRCFNSLEEEERGHAAYDFYENGGGDAVDFDVGGSPDTYCGSSFLKETTITKLHFSVAEAT